MHMKRFFPILLFAAAVLSCGQTHYQIDGLWDAEDGTPVWLIDTNAGDTLAQTTVRGGRFSFEGNAREPY
jgi:hypothetical protein